MIYKIMIWMSLFTVVMLSGTEASAQSSQNLPLPTKVSLCQMLSDPSKYADVEVIFRARVTPFRHGTQLSDQKCPKQTISLIAEAHAADTAPVIQFYRFLGSHRQSEHPVFATLTGRLLRKPYGEFIVKRDQVFQLDMVSDFSEANVPTKR